MTKRILMGIGLLTLVASTWAMTAGRSGAAAAAAAPAAKASDVIAAPGRVEAMTESVDVSAEITGRLEQVYVDEGDRVNAGQVIATIDPSDARAKLASAEAQHWLRPVGHRLFRVAPAAFLDVGHASHGLVTSNTRTQFDLGGGVRLSMPGAGVLRIDLARGLRDGTTALSVGWQR